MDYANLKRGEHPTLLLTPGSTHAYLREALGVDMMLYHPSDISVYVASPWEPVTDPECALCGVLKSPLWQNKRFCGRCFAELFAGYTLGLFTPQHLDVQGAIANLKADHAQLS